ncbi:MAG: hypothetical protein AB7G25_17910 [Sphingomonadaceae bacterium]
MILGLSLVQFTQLHVIISLIAIAAGLIFFLSLAGGRWLMLPNGAFLLFTVLTSVTGFMFPPKPIGPPFIFGVISLGLLAVALFALYGKRLAGRWRGGYLAAALFAQYLNMVVLVVQSFQKIPALNAFAPTGAEPALLVTQVALLIGTLVVGWRVIARVPVGMTPKAT